MLKFLHTYLLDKLPDFFRNGNWTNGCQNITCGKIRLPKLVSYIDSGVSSICIPGGFIIAVDM